MHLRCVALSLLILGTRFVLELLGRYEKGAILHYDANISWNALE